jgi:melibiose permease
VKNDQLVVIILSMIAYTLAINITAGLGLYYFKYDIGNEGLYGTFYLAAGASQVLAMLLFPAFAKWFTRRKVFIIAALCPLFGYVGLFLTGKFMGGNIILLTVVGMILFFGFGFANVLTSVMLADAVDYGEWKLGYRSESIVFSMQVFMVKVAMAISGAITGLGLAAFGFIANRPQSVTALAGIRTLMFIVPSFLIIISLAIYMKYFKLNGAYYNVSSSS